MITIRSQILLLFLFGGPVCSTTFAVSIPCTGEKDSEWVQGRQEALQQESLFRFVLSEAGSPTSCKAKLTQNGPDGKFGSITYEFKNGFTYTAESLPPESSVVTLDASNGFTSEPKAVRQLKEAAAKTGLQINWTAKPELGKEGETETKTFWDPDEGRNGRGFLTYKKGKLISIGFGMAL